MTRWLIPMALALAGCATTPDLCGVPYTEAEDRAGVEHDCGPGDPERAGQTLASD